MSEHPNAAVIRSAYEAMSEAMDKADVDAFAALLDDGIIWYESTAGVEGVYRGRDEVVALLGQVFQQPGMQMSVAVHHMLANDEHAVILHESTITVGDRNSTGQYADVYHLRDENHGALAPRRRRQGGRRIRLRGLRELTPRRVR